MAFPLIPFAAGFAVGSLVTYGYKDKTVHDYVVHEFGQLYALVASRVTAIRDMAAHLSPPRLQVPGELKALTRGVQETITKTESAASELVGKVENAAESVAARSQETAEAVARTAEKTTRKVRHTAESLTDGGRRLA